METLGLFPYRPISFKPQLSHHQGRFSAIGAQLRTKIVAYENMVTVMDHWEGRRTKKFVEDPMVVPRRIMGSWKPQHLDELPEAFCGGWVGYFSYDTVRYVEKKLPFSSAPKDDRNLPDIHLGLYDEVIVFDHMEKARGCILVASSLEILTRVRKRKITNRPLAGIARRWKITKEDYVLEQQLLHDEKQCLEHITLVDLARNDVGKPPACTKGLILQRGLHVSSRAKKISDLRTVLFQNLVLWMLKSSWTLNDIPMSCTSARRVTGELSDHLTSWDALWAALPVGTVSAAPKVLYHLPSSAYNNAPVGRVAHLQAGAGIVADSDPVDEQLECENKIEAPECAIDHIESSFVQNL
ncbi:hypothetical protein RHGRI_024492 [Rhododendron griersonianum]|uniref:Uncharacterized protein n=1 Tax=Rhododendron griersonianum TaxID=479676 RepID=A0AAV6JCK2_9ERIC|nr:hypothetical protein RHGRI_024492 [Rhododendron griersonianum]